MSSNFKEKCSTNKQRIESLKDISTWNNEIVCEWLNEIQLTQYVETFRNNNINGYDLCYITSQELLNELNITKLHDRNCILKKIRENILKQLKLKFKYKDKIVDILFDYESSLTVANLIPYLKDVFNIQERILVYNGNNELISINCKIIELCLINPSFYKTFYIESELRKSDMNSKIEGIRNTSELLNDNLNVNNQRFCYNNSKKRNMLKNQILQEADETNHSQIALDLNKNLSQNNYINITEDYKFEYPKNIQIESKNLSHTNFNFLPTNDERKLNSIQIHVARNILDQKERKQLSEYDIKYKKHDNYLQANTIRNEESLLNSTNTNDYKKNMLDYRSKLENVRSDIYNSWKKVQSPITSINEKKFEN